MKIIELLNRIAGDEEVPKKVWFNGRLYEYEEECNMAYRYKYRGSDCTLGLFGMIDNFNDEVEVIEEEKEIEKLNLDTDELKGKETVRAIDYLLEGKINELIDLINDMRDKEC